jgi:hypothetical protein
MTANGQTALSRDAERRLHRDQAAAEAVARRKRFYTAVEKMKAAGFTDAQSQFAAMAYLTMAALGGPAPTRVQVEARVRSQYPFLFEGGS